MVETNTMLLDQAPSPAADLIKNTDMKGFTADVIEASRQVPVLVDFWAPWCGPCKQLTPVLEKLVTAARGKVRLVKINIDENQQIAAQMRVQSIPAVFAFVNGQPVDGFMGALPESQIKQFIDRLGSQGGLAEQIAEALTAGRTSLAAADYVTAADIADQIMGVDPNQVEAYALKARAEMGVGDLVAAEATLALVPAEKAGHDEVLSAKAALALLMNPVETSEVAKLAEALAANPNEHQLRIDLAVALNGAGQRTEATDHLIHIIRKERAWNDEAARKQLVLFFEGWGQKDDATIAARRKLSSVLFA
jgi:putative thioredoxin